MAKASTDLIEAMHDIAKDCQPITGRGVGYKLFVAKLIASMSRRDMQRVYRLLTVAREREIIPWEWIVDETRVLEWVATWANPEAFICSAKNSYRRDFWNSQPVRIQVWSEKATVAGVLAPVLDDYGVGFMSLHGFSGGRATYDVSVDGDDPLVILYVGDYDPSGMCMSEVDLPNRFVRRGGDHIRLDRIAIVRRDHHLPWFQASDKHKDTRYKWFVKNYGERCWEVDAMDPNDLRERVEEAIRNEIDPTAWKRCELLEAGEQASLREALNGWGNGR